MSPAIEINDSLYLTGNIIYENDVASAITHCEKLGYPREDIIIDSLLAGSIYSENFNPEGMKTIDVMIHASKLVKFY
ncbi:MAG: hypothetical protein ACKO96_12505 [Flammeovirgaceae bacterium]